MHVLSQPRTQSKKSLLNYAMLCVPAVLWLVSHTYLPQALAEERIRHNRTWLKMNLTNDVKRSPTIDNNSIHLQAVLPNPLQDLATKVLEQIASDLPGGGSMGRCRFRPTPRVGDRTGRKAGSTVFCTWPN